MSLPKTQCPECRAGLKSPTGFTVGQTVCCPKCESYFTVADPDDEVAGEEDAPRPKKRRAYDEDDDAPARPYKNSPLRYAILGVLVVTMLVLGYFLVQKWRGDRETADAGNNPNASDPFGPIPPPPAGPNPIRQPFGKGPNPKRPNPVPKVPNPPPAPVGVNPLGGLLGGPQVLPPAQRDALVQKYKAALVGTWSADLGGGTGEELTYAADGTFSARRTGADPATASGKYSVTGLSGTRSLKIQLDTQAGPRSVVAVFEGDELQHPTLQKGVTGSFRKK